MNEEKSGILQLNSYFDDYAYDMIGKLEASDNETEEGKDFLTVSDDDTLSVPVRALSKTIVSHGIDFGKDDVLKGSTRKLRGKTIYKNHHLDVDNWVGSVADTSWSEKDPGRPAGINAVLDVDIKQAPSIARGLLVKNSPVHATSVTVNFEYERSHPELSDHEFWNCFGKKLDGKVVRFIATKIIDYHEISFVYRGSDPFASRLNLSQADLSKFDHTYYDDNRIRKELSGMAKEWDSKSLSLSVNLEKTPSGLFLTPNSIGESLMDAKALRQSLGLAETASDADVLVALSKQTTELARLKVEANENKSQIEQLTTDKQTLIDEKTLLTNQLAEKSELADIGKAALDHDRAVVEKLYRLSVEEGKEQEEVVTTIKNSSGPTLNALRASFKSSAEGRLGYKLDQSGEKVVDLQSSEGNDGNPNPKTEKSVSGLSNHLHD